MRLPGTDFLPVVFPQIAVERELQFGGLCRAINARVGLEFGRGNAARVVLLNGECLGSNPPSIHENPKRSGIHGLGRGLLVFIFAGPCHGHREQQKARNSHRQRRFELHVRTPSNCCCSRFIDVDSRNLAAAPLIGVPSGGWLPRPPLPHLCPRFRCATRPSGSIGGGPHITAGTLSCRRATDVPRAAAGSGGTILPPARPGKWLTIPPPGAGWHCWPARKHRRPKPQL